MFTEPAFEVDLGNPEVESIILGEKL